VLNSLFDREMEVY